MHLHRLRYASASCLLSTQHLCRAWSSKGGLQAWEMPASTVHLQQISGKKSHVPDNHDHIWWTVCGPWSTHLSLACAHI